jgi:MFS transporter, SHS family, lactate transporter
MTVTQSTAENTSLSRSDQWHAVSASFLGWTLDAFDFFVVVFLVDTLAVQFHVPTSKIILTITATLAMRPLGALVFGLLADRYGRRRPMMANVVFFSVCELLCGFAPNYTMFLILRSIFGIGMGGEWGLGASLAMESAPKRSRGVLSGIIQSGYPAGYLLAALAARFVLPAWGWRGMFWIGGVPALLAFYIRFRVKESEAWKQHRVPTMGAILRTASGHWKLFSYLVLLMTLMMFLSHGTQDLYPHFLREVHNFPVGTVSYVAILFNVGAILGSFSFGYLSEKLGRRRTILVALALALAVIPIWAFGGSLATLALGAFFMQVGVQGAWGVIPAHLNELAPDAVRGLMPGFAYQLGILFAAPTNTVEYGLRNWVGYSWALAGFEIATILILGTVVALGSEQKGKSFVRDAEKAEYSGTPPRF